MKTIELRGGNDPQSLAFVKYDFLLREIMYQPTGRRLGAGALFGRGRALLRGGAPGHRRRTRRQPALPRLGCAAQEIDQPVIGILAIALLRAEIAAPE